MNPSRPSLLIVDDEPEVLRTLYDLFRIQYQVLTYSNPRDALDRLAGDDVPVVMSDQTMPGMTGVEFLRKVKELRPDTTRLLFTGYSDIHAVIDAINEGNVFRYITKPWDPDDLASAIRQAVDYHDLKVSRRALLEELQYTNRQLSEANRLKSAFIEVASHELNTPVAVVLGLTELWKLTAESEADETTRSWIERIRGAGTRLASIVERMLKLLQAGQFADTLQTQPTDLAELIARAVSDVQPFLEARRQRITQQIPDNLGSADIDAEKIADVITNLLVNAIKFTPDDREILVKAESLPNEEVRLAVTDPGVGINAEERRHLFEPFFTCFDTMRHSSGKFQFCKRGIGLGLHLVKTFVELHGGRVEDVNSEPGMGSTFSIILPRVPRKPANGSPGPPGTRPQLHADGNGSGGSPRDSR